MAATFSLTYFVNGLLNGKLQEMGSLYDPATVTTSADIMSQDEIAVATATATTIATLTTAAVLIVLVPSVTTQFVWRTTAADSDNNSAVVPAGCPFFLYTSGLPYQTTSSNRVDETAANITGITAYQATGSTSKVATLILG